MRECDCGCGKTVGDNRKYAYGHAAKIAAERGKVDCKCGCGQKIIPFDKQGRPKSYVSGHNRRKYEHGDKNAHQKAWVKKNRKWANSRRRRVREETRREIIELCGGQCVNCGLEYDGKNAAVFDFHHRDPSTKETSVSAAINSKSKAVTIREAKKCDILCANCHRIHHHGEY